MPVTSMIQVLGSGTTWGGGVQSVQGGGVQSCIHEPVKFGSVVEVPYWNTTVDPNSLREKGVLAVRVYATEFLIRGPCPVTPPFPVPVLSPALRMP